MDREAQMNEILHNLGDLLEEEDAPPLIPDPVESDQPALDRQPPTQPKNTLLDELGLESWHLGMLGISVAVTSRVAMLMIEDSSVAGQETKDWLAALLPLTLSTGAWCFLACLLGSLIYLRRHIGTWTTFLLTEVVALAGSMAFIGIVGAFLLSFADDGSEAAREITAVIGFAAVLGVLLGNFELMGYWRTRADQARAPKLISLAEEPPPEDIILD